MYSDNEVAPPVEVEAGHDVIGTSVRPVDWKVKTDGSLRYAGDLDFPGMLIGAVVRSPHPHARIVSIDTSDAKRIPGVHAVLVGSDLPDRRYNDYRSPDADRYALARGRVRHIGDPVAVVAADDLATAQRAAAAVRVDYRALRPANSVAEALDTGAVALHDSCPDNVARHTVQTFGNQDDARRATTVRVKRRYESSRQAHATMEPHTVVAQWSASESRLHLWAPSQAPRVLHRDIVNVLELRPEQLHMHEVGVGGDFGGRTQISHLEVLAGALSMATERPVRLAHTREEEFAFTKSRVPWELELDLGCDQEGLLTNLSAVAEVDNGGYNMAGPGEMDYGLVALGSSYRLRSYEADGRCVYTTKQPQSSFRGAGGYPVNFALECVVDELAEKAGIDPIDFRKLNAVSQDGEETITGWQVRTSRLIECLDTVRRESDWDVNRLRGGKGYGIGVACSIHVTALHRAHMMKSSAALDMFPDGQITLRSGCGDAGTGQKTILCQAVAEVLGVDAEDVRIISTDTALTPEDSGAGASRGSWVSMSTVKQLAEDVSERLRDAAADKFHVGRDEVALKEGEAHANGNRIPLADLVVLARDPDCDSLTVSTDFVGQINDVPGYGHEDLAPTYSFAAQVVQVEVDLDTGKVKVLRVVAAHDSGTILNPITAQGQVEGGIVMGLGAALSEELIYEGGRVVNTGYVDYALPRAADAPPIETHFVGVTDTNGPFGAKGLGEIVLLPTGAALANAIAHATGVRLAQAPFTPDRVLTALREHAGQTTRAVKRSWRPHLLWIDCMRRAYPLGLHTLLHRFGPGRAPGRGDRALSTVTSPASLAEALADLQRLPDAAPAGGMTDLLVAHRQDLPTPTSLVLLSGAPELRTIVEERGDLVLGSAVTLRELEDDPRVPAVLREACAEIASPQIREVATIAGNLCQVKRCWFFRNGFDCYKRGGAGRPCYAVMGDHRFHHAVQDAHRCQAVTPSDLATPLLALGARVEVAGSNGRRTLSVDELYTGPGETTLAPTDVITSIRLPASALGRRGTYRKLAQWQGGFAIASVCVVSEPPVSGRFPQRVAIAVGGVAPTPVRLDPLVRPLAGHPVDDSIIEQVASAWVAGTHPLKGNEWKVHATANLITSALREVLDPVVVP